ncbi:alpha/beta hydrolase [Methyloligella sp. 2.7D]|uniref:alpha/beta hydrolase n=1 Tax=unclassified Methyloligella TaxID=2625955 RepID=UPI00157DEF1B|nr:alpha/beta hydrolase [Methyloligella sp. GL2]QKP76861.1 alpha/beta hydrolase [Methyloligella sp. GL2]
MSKTQEAIERLEPQTRKFIDSLAGATPIYTLSPEEARGVLAGAQKSVEVTLAPADVEDRTLDIGPTGKTKIRIYRPQGVQAARPAVIYAHGGGWILGDVETHERLVRELTAATGAVFVFVDYERSPEARYPVAVEQIYATLDYVAAHPEEFGVDASRLAVAGDSVGGNMAAVTAILAKERGGPKLAAQVLAYPVTDASMSSASYQDFADGPWLTKPAMTWFWDAYLPEVEKRADIHVSPLNADAATLSGLPQALVVVDENDVLRDEGEAYARKLSEAGVSVTAVRYNGTIHDFLLLNPIAGTPATRAAVDQAVGYLKKVLAS